MSSSPEICDTKRRFKTWEQANKHADWMKAEYGKSSKPTIYRCSVCSDYHLSYARYKKVRRKKRRVR